MTGVVLSMPLLGWDEKSQKIKFLPLKKKIHRLSFGFFLVHFFTAVSRLNNLSYNVRI